MTRLFLCGDVMTGRGKGIRDRLHPGNAPVLRAARLARECIRLGTAEAA